MPRVKKFCPRFVFDKSFKTKKAVLAIFDLSLAGDTSNARDTAVSIDAK